MTWIGSRNPVIHSHCRFTKDNSDGWSPWVDWFGAFDAAPPAAQVQMFDNCVHALNAATGSRSAMGPTAVVKLGVGP